ncbi:related to cell wall mannoprotein [Phialocephala subalpina]|uniref:Related to cell wall mannoprotein n=1 Tax=Phialocephala subalpina TaxID=576137 RepID=A0A1L7X605_9HELO|nr:related to cell wall mannoprotein [Phialocephala subalpina]
MGSFVFKWDHPASEVYVTGTFDNWEKTEKLIKTGDTFAKDVTLPSAAEKIYYKFVVDGVWTTDHTAPQENDASGNLNNVLTIDRIKKHTPETAGIMSGVAPTSTTAALAKDVPLEKESTGSSDLPGSFPETPAAIEKGDFSVNPLPAADGAVNPIKLAPGEKVPHPSTFTNNTVTSGVHDDPELVAAAKKENDQTFSVSPLPAFAGGVNPVNVAPGEKIPASEKLTANTINSGVTTDKESYEKSGGLGNAPVLPPVVTPAAERAQNGTGVFDLPPAKNLIPESSLPIGAAGVGSYDASPTIQSAAPTSTTAQLAAAVPLESSKVPEVVKESQEEAGVAPEASAIPAEVTEKSAIEKELLKEVPVAPSTSEGTAGKGTDKSESTAAKDTPEVVKESIAESGQSPEAAANEEAVLEKKAVEKELLSEIKPETSTGESAPQITSTGTSSGLNAPASAAVAGKPTESRDVSPGTVPGSHTETQTAPTVTSGVATATTDKTSTPAAPSTPAKSTTATPSTPAKDTPGSSKAGDSPASSATADKKKKRTSLFGKLKAKLSHKD